MAKKIYNVLRKIRKKATEYISTNRLFLSFVVLAIIETVLVRHFTLGNSFSYKPFICDLAFIIILGSLGYLIKPQKQFAYFFSCLIFITATCIINSIYFTFYQSFASFGLIATVSQVGDVADSLVEKLRFTDFIYIFAPILFYYIHRMLHKTNYYNYVSKIELGKKSFIATFLAGFIFLALTIVSMTGTDYSRLSKLWNREYIVERFGIILYQGNDLIQSLTPKINSLFGYDEAARTYRNYYSENEIGQVKNKYTNLLNGKNVIFVHMESIQSFLIDLEIKEEQVTPNINRLKNEGMYFSNFYPQVSVGTSSDTEFTLLTSLMPAQSGTVFVSYYDRYYLSIPKILKEKGYYTFSMHGNKADMWNRAKAHASLGYDKFYAKPSFEFSDEEKIGLGISDSAFFRQVAEYLKEIEEKYEKYMGTIITLSNHSPFDDLDKYGEFDLTYTTTKFNEKTGLEEEVIDKYLDDTKIGNYLKSSHYADHALGEFMSYIEESDYFNDTVFVFYGDHDAKLSKSEFNFLYNYDPETGKLKTEEDETYYDYDNFENELNKNTPLIIWSKDKKIQKSLNSVIDYPMGMYDLLPTLGNMMDFYSPYAVGNDVFNKKEDNIVIFPNGNFLTNTIYFNNSSETFKLLKENTVLDDDYIKNCKEYAEIRLEVSNNIIIHDLIYKESNKANYSEVE